MSEESRRRGIFLSFSQIVVLWCVIVVTMVAVFFFGLSAGRSQGIQLALEQSGRESVRLPLLDPALVNKAIENSVDENSIDERSIEEASIAQEEVNTSTTVAGSDVSKQQLLAQKTGGADTARSAADAIKEASEKATKEASLAKLKNDSTSAASANANNSKSEVANIASTGAGFSKRSTPDLLASNQKLDVELDKKKTAANEDSSKSKEELAKAKAAEDAVKKAELENAKLAIAAAAAKKAEDQRARELAAQKVAQQTAQAKAASQPTARAKLDEKPIAAPKKEAIRNGWYVQVRAAESGKEALELMRGLKQKGISSLIQMANVSSKVYYRVLVGPFGNKNSAQEKQKEIKSLAISKGDPFLKYIN